MGKKNTTLGIPDLGEPVNPRDARLEFEALSGGIPADLVELKQALSQPKPPAPSIRVYTDETQFEPILP